MSGADSGGGGRRQVAEACLDLLLIQILAHNTAAVQEADAATDGEASHSSQQSDGNGSQKRGAIQGVPPKLSAEQSAALDARIEGLGFEVGYRLVERTCQQRFLVGEQLEVIKFICKEFWTEVFRKQVDKLQTDHKGTFVLKDTNFRLVARYAAGASMSRSVSDRTWAGGIDNSAANRELVRRLLLYPCGLVRGAVANLGLSASVRADFGRDDRDGGPPLPAITITITMGRGPAVTARR
ncbi:unnamed protein product [Phaeothamnion confervicola]